ncbi:MAG: hypothetical protein RIR52_2581 [Acidobacteriota bacterium]
MLPWRTVTTPDANSPIKSKSIEKWPTAALKSQHHRAIAFSCQRSSPPRGSGCDLADETERIPVCLTRRRKATKDGRPIQSFFFPTSIPGVRSIIERPARSIWTIYMDDSGPAPKVLTRDRVSISPLRPFIITMCQGSDTTVIKVSRGVNARNPKEGNAAISGLDLLH